MSRARGTASAYRPVGGGAVLRADIIDLYLVTRPRAGALAFLQVLRAKEPLRGTWHPLMGHAEPGENAVNAAWRELREEAGLTRGYPQLRGMWALQGVHPFYVPGANAVVLSPRFVVEVAKGWTPPCSNEHSRTRWVPASRCAAAFLWPGQRAACVEARELLGSRGARLRELLRVD